MNLKRKSGVLLHITSLPGRWGMGELGPEARAFGEFLHRSGQSLWQILPTGPVGYGFAPYSSLSASAGNHLLISFDELLDQGLLSKTWLEDFPVFDREKIDFPSVIAAREEVLFQVAAAFDSTPEFEAFCVASSDWLPDYCLFMAIRETNDNAGWLDWPAALRDRSPKALDQARAAHGDRVRCHQVLQYLFYSQWNTLRSYIKDLGIEWVGDIPIFVAGDSADVWANRELFFLDDAGRPTVVAGVPPDYFSETGQRWGNPLYDWEAHRETAYAWWTQRMQRTFELVDIVRVDHFRGFEDYWEIPADEPTAINGKWITGPRKEFFDAVEANLRKLPAYGSDFVLADHVIAEDLGIITDEVEVLRDACGFPGMILLQFRFGDEEMALEGYVPEGDVVNSVVYSGTHDNDTTLSWYAQITEEERHPIRVYLQCDGSQIHRDFVNLAMSSPAKWAIHPLQDVLGKGLRMNTPGVAEGNWDWRVSGEWLTDSVADEFRELTRKWGRLESTDV